ncbi:MAG: hypothetical protein ACE5K9_08665 [Candidatus Methylomirabilales bacterium]
MRKLAILGVLGLAVSLGAASADADVVYELVVRTSDSRVRGMVELEGKVTMSVKGDRMRQEMSGTLTVVTRRGARYRKPRHRVTLDQLDRGLRYEIDLDAETYIEAPYASLRQQREEEIAAAEKVLGMNSTGPLPSLAVSVDRTGERHLVHGRECERVVLKSTREVVLAATRGRGPAEQTPSRFSMTFDLCITPDTGLMREARAVEDRVADLTGMRGALEERQLRIFGYRRDILAAFELMHRLMEHEQHNLGGVPIRWEWVLVGPKGDQPQVTLFHHWGEVTRIEDRVLDTGHFDIPPGLKREQRTVAEGGHTW